jgi:hypothetical protein
MIMAFVGIIIQYERGPMGIAIMPSGSITLEQVAARTAALAVACSRCDRAGRYNLGALIAGHGPKFGIPALLRLLSADCPKRNSTNAYDLCGVHCPELSTLFLLNRKENAR